MVNFVVAKNLSFFYVNNRYITKETNILRGLLVLRIIICEDNAEYLNLLEDYVNHTLESGNIAGEVVCAATHPDEVESYLTQGDANVFLFDIDLNSDKNGYELAVKIRENNPEAYLVFISEHLEYVFQSFKVRPFDFLPKPVTMKRLSGKTRI